MTSLVFGPPGTPVFIAAYVFRDNLKYAQAQMARSVALGPVQQGLSAADMATARQLAAAGDAVAGWRFLAERGDVYADRAYCAVALPERTGD